jgi:hypothetical protein
MPMYTKPLFYLSSLRTTSFRRRVRRLDPFTAS